MSEKQSTGPTSQFKKSRDVELGTAVINKVTVTTYKSKVRDLKLRSKEWLPKWKSPDQHYFEIQVLSVGAKKISLGIVDEKNCEFEYQADGRVLYDGKTITYDTEARFDQKNAVVGCGVDFDLQQMFFVLPDGDKRYLPVNSRFDPMISFAPFVTLNKQAEQIAVNFGERKFMHDPFGEAITKIPSFFAKEEDITQKLDSGSTVKFSTNGTGYRSLQANCAFNRSNRTTFPYFEIKIVRTEGNIMLGFSDKYSFRTHQPLGTIVNSVGWSDGQNAQFDHLTSTHHSGPLVQASGDIFGCGIAVDSYNATRVFITKNGKWIGFVTQSRKVHGGYIECYPTISILGSATLSYNFGASKFGWDPKQAPIFRSTAGINVVPEEILQIIFEYAGHSEAFCLLSMAPVNKTWHRIMPKNDRLWRRLYYAKFPNQNPELKVKLWSIFFKQRAQAMKSVSDPHPIENCNLAFKCPLILENFKNLSPDATKTFCDTCQKDVYIVASIEQLKQYASVGRCVAWKLPPEDDSEEHDYMGGLFE
jgi:hypothetical protein